MMIRKELWLSFINLLFAEDGSWLVNIGKDGALDEWKTAGSKKDAVNKAERLSERKGLPIEEEARINIM